MGFIMTMVPPSISRITGVLLFSGCLVQPDISTASPSEKQAEKNISKMYGDLPANFPLMGGPDLGVKEGCAGSLAIAGNTMFFPSSKSANSAIQGRAASTVPVRPDTSHSVPSALSRYRASPRAANPAASDPSSRCHRPRWVSYTKRCRGLRGEGEAVVVSVARQVRAGSENKTIS